jgi:hypothetical protein
MKNKSIYEKKHFFVVLIAGRSALRSRYLGLINCMRTDSASMVTSASSIARELVPWVWLSSPHRSQENWCHEHGYHCIVDRKKIDAVRVVPSTLLIVSKHAWFSALSTTRKSLSPKAWCCDHGFIFELLFLVIVQNKMWRNEKFLSRGEIKLDGSIRYFQETSF